MVRIARRTTPRGVPGVAAWSPVERLHVIDLKVLGHSEEPGARSAGQDASERIRPRIGQAGDLQDIGTAQVSQGNDPFPTITPGAPDFAVIDHCPEPLPGLGCQGPHVVLLEIAAGGAIRIDGQETF
jgi:hypothetical protein